jgi:hypothetical protein
MCVREMCLCVCAGDVFVREMCVCACAWDVSVFVCVRDPKASTLNPTLHFKP